MNYTSLNPISIIFSSNNILEPKIISVAFLDVRLTSGSYWIFNEQFYVGISIDVSICIILLWVSQHISCELIESIIAHIIKINIDFFFKNFNH